MSSKSEDNLGINWSRDYTKHLFFRILVMQYFEQRTKNHNARMCLVNVCQKFSSEFQSLITII